MLLPSRCLSPICDIAVLQYDRAIGTRALRPNCLRQQLKVCVPCCFRRKGRKAKTLLLSEPILCCANSKPTSGTANSTSEQEQCTAVEPGNRHGALIEACIVRVSYLPKWYPGSPRSICSSRPGSLPFHPPCRGFRSSRAGGSRSSESLSLLASPLFPSLERTALLRSIEPGCRIGLEACFGLYREKLT